MVGTVIKSTGSWYIVRMDDTQEIMSCRIIGKFRLGKLKLTNPVAVGDKVVVEKDVEGGIIKEIKERSNYVVRQSPRKKHQLHLIASNIDQAYLLITIKSPNLKQGFIDRYILMTEPYNIPVEIIFNKSDLLNEKDLGLYEYLKSIYISIGYGVHLVSSFEPESLIGLKEKLKNKITLVGGQSGVGKSTFINAIVGNEELQTTEISDYSGKGQHTTTFAEMFEISANTHLIDTPGIKTLSYNHLEPMDVAHNFKEFFKASSNCKFADCSHRNEPQCAIKEGMEKGTISELRYFNYIAILEEIESQNYWERNSDL